MSKEIIAQLVAALELMLAHSCVADAGSDMKDAEDHDAERKARAALAAAKPAPAIAPREPSAAAIVEAIDVWIECELASDNSIPDFWHELNTSERLAEFLSPMFSSTTAGQPDPDGWVLVPVEPTKAMLNQIVGSVNFQSSELARQLYARVIAAAPKGGQ